MISLPARVPRNLYRAGVVRVHHGQLGRVPVGLVPGPGQQGGVVQDPDHGYHTGHGVVIVHQILPGECSCVYIEAEDLLQVLQHRLEAGG